MQLGYIFDLDGVITDTIEFHYQAWKRIADQEGIPFDRTINDRLRGIPRRRSLDILLDGRQYPEAKIQQLMEQKNTYFYEYLELMNPSDILPGVHELLIQARDWGIQLGVASASQNAKAVCERLGLLEFFSVIGDANSVARPKPDPDIFIWVAGWFGLHPRYCLVFEDSDTGVQAARLGGFWTVALGPVAQDSDAHWKRQSLAGARIEDFDIAAKLTG